MPADFDWRKLINSYSTELPEDGIVAPPMESIKEKFGKRKLLVQKLTIDIFIYTDLENKLFGQTAFQALDPLGEMTVERLERLLNKETRKRQGKSD